MTSLRWGILSTADIGRRKVIPGIRKAARCEIVAIASRDAAQARRVADELGIPTAHGSYEALLADPDVDAVYIPLPNHLHAEWTIAAARAAKHVLCEKPLAMTAADAERMAEVCAAEGVRLMEAFMYRHHPAWVAAMEVVASGRIGRLRAVQSWFSYYNDDPANIRNQLEAGGGALFDIGCYSVNLSRMLFGAEPIRVSAGIVRDPALGVDTLTSAIL
jgi:predicted dehydrogenase